MPMLTTRAAAAALGVTPGAIRARLQRGSLSGHRSGVHWLVDVPDDAVPVARGHQQPLDPGIGLATTRSLTVRDAAAALGMTPGAIHGRLKRGEFTGHRVNARGPKGYAWMVDVPDDAIRAVRARQPPADPGAAPGPGQAPTAERDVLREQVADLRAERDRLLDIIATLAAR